MVSQVESTRRKRKPPCPVLVLGLGNILLRDEGVGVRVVEAMGLMDLPGDVELFDGATAGLDLLDTLAERRKVIAIDAMDADCEPGTVLRLKPENLSRRRNPAVSLHEIGLLETLAAADLLGIAPRDVVILGVKPFDTGCGLDLSCEIRGLVPRIVELVMTELET